jgi:hypothetical protein
MLQKVCLKTRRRKGVSNWLGVEDWFYVMRCWALSLLWFRRALFIEQDALCTLICICSLCHYRFIAKGWFANTHCVCVRSVQVLREIQEQYQWKMTQLCAKQAKQRKEFLHNEEHMCYQQPLPTGYGHYSYTWSEPSYTDSLPYDHTDSDISHSHVSVYESYSDTGVASYNRKHGQDACKVYSKSQVYETSSYPYVGSPPYPAYGWVFVEKRWGVTQAGNLAGCEFGFDWWSLQQILGLAGNWVRWIQ